MVGVRMGVDYVKHRDVSLRDEVVHKTCFLRERQRINDNCPVLCEDNRGRNFSIHTTGKNVDAFRHPIALQGHRGLQRTWPKMVVRDQDNIRLCAMSRAIHNRSHRMGIRWLHFDQVPRRAVCSADFEPAFAGGNLAGQFSFANTPADTRAAIASLPAYPVPRIIVLAQNALRASRTPQGSVRCYHSSPEHANDQNTGIVNSSAKRRQPVSLHDFIAVAT